MEWKQVNTIIRPFTNYQKEIWSSESYFDPNLFNTVKKKLFTRTFNFTERYQVTPCEFFKFTIDKTTIAKYEK